MAFWIAAGLIAAAVAALLLGALRAGGKGALSGAASDLAVYRDQLKELERDLARGVLTEAEAETVRTEVSRRLLDADRRAQEGVQASAGRGASGPALLLPVAAIAAGVGLYVWIGVPGMADLPMRDRIAALDAARQARPPQAEAEALAAPNLPKQPEPDANFLDLMERLRAALAERPGDVQGLTLLAQNEARLGNYAAAREAQEQLVAAKGGAAAEDDLLMLLDMMVFSAGGYVSPEAEAVLARILNSDPESGAGRYYLGLLEAQSGRPDRAFPIWRKLLETSAPDAPWMPVIRAEIDGLAAAAGVRYQAPEMRGPSAGDVAAAAEMSEEDRQAMIRTMIEGLAERLATDGGPATDWARLIGALGVLGETERARTIADEAETVFASDPASLETIRAARAQAGIAE